MMKYFRYALYAALFAVTMMLWQAWQIEHPSKKIDQQIQVDSKTVQLNQNNSNEEYSFHKNVNTQVNAVSQSEIKEIPKDRLIHVKTDVLDIDIDTLGGSIIYLDLKKYPQELKSKQPFILMQNQPDDIYIAQSGLILPDKNLMHERIQYQSAQKDYNLSAQNDLSVTLNGKTADGLSVEKTFIFKTDSYAVTLKYNIKNISNRTWEGSEYLQFLRSMVPNGKSVLGFKTFTGVAVSSPDHPYQRHTFKDLGEEQISMTAQGGWLASVQHYFVSAWVPNKDQQYRYYSKVSANQVVTAGAIGPNIILKPGQSIEFSSQFYGGPKIASRLNELSPKLWLTIDFGWLWFISIIIFKALKFINIFIGNWGWSIVILTILIKAIFYPLSAVSYKSMAAMRKLQPKVQKLKEQYGDDKQAMSRAMMDLYKKEKINPLGGCLPILIQIPVFIALYYVLLESVELRQAPFIFWIHDLATKDPYYILPILMGASMFFQQKLSPAPPDPTQAKVMLFLPVIMTVLFISFPAGLVLYWLVNNVISIAQQWYIMKRYNDGAYNKAKSMKKKPLRKRK